jgi:hypothetical protein
MKKLILLVAIFVFFYCVFPVFLMGGWLFAWNYRKALTINNTSNSNSLTDYQVLTTLDTQSLISSGKMRSDCGDIRFTDSDGQTQLNYWIESGCNTSSTKIWVKVPSIPASSSKIIYFYYGNPSATSASNGTNTFDFFDDCESGSATDKWQVAFGSPIFICDTTEKYEGSKSLKLTLGGSDDGIIAKNLNISNAVFQAYVKSTSLYNMLTARAQASYNFYFSRSNYTSSAPTGAQLGKAVNLQYV